MWIAMNDSFVSIVDNGQGPEGTLTVRSRVEGDLVALGFDPIATPNRDYQFRAYVPRCRVAALISDRLSSIDYDNFKGSVTEPRRHRAYLTIWSAMYSFGLESFSKLTDRPRGVPHYRGPKYHCKGPKYRGYFKKE